MSPMQPIRQIWVPGSLLGSATKLQRFPRLRPHHSLREENKSIRCPLRAVFNWLSKVIRRLRLVLVLLQYEVS